MSMRRNWMIFAFATLFLAVTGMDLCTKDRLFSENENRMLQQKPVFSVKNFLSGQYGKECDAYVTDQFVGRDNWIRLKTGTELALGETLLNGIYIGSDGYLFEQHLSVQAGGSGVLEENTDRKLTKLVSDLEGYRNVRIMLVPSAAALLPEKLPPHAAGQEFDQTAFLEQAEQTVSDGLSVNTWVDVKGLLEEHREEDIYYKTDHHWTTLGAYYGYRAWAESMGYEPKSLKSYERECVAEDFQGTLQSRLNLSWEPDRIEVFRSLQPFSYEVTYDAGAKGTHSLYEESYLNTKNKYGYFLDDNHALVEIQTEGSSQPQRSLAVIKDSYANCLIPFLTEHYGRVYVMDKRYYHGSVDALMEEKGIDDLLVLYQVTSFLDNY